MRKLSQSHLGSFLKEMLHKECEQEAASKGEGRTRLYRCMRGFVTGWATSQTERKEVAVSFLYSVISRFSDLGPCRAYAEGTAAPLVALAFFLAFFSSRLTSSMAAEAVEKVSSSCCLSAS